ncbi:MAG: DUF1254 domain-containing protein [Pseudomonadota bacterium]
MKTLIALALVPLVLLAACERAEKAQPEQLAGDPQVLPENFIRAETDLAFHRLQTRGGGPNAFSFLRAPTPLDAQSIVRMNRDTLYGAAIVDTANGASIEIPNIDDSRYISVQIIDNDHYTPAVFYEPGVHQIPTATRYVAAIVRVEILDANSPSDIAQANAIQDQFVVRAASAVPMPAPTWDMRSFLKLRNQYKQEFHQYAQFGVNWMGPRGEVDEETRHIVAAAGWGLLPSRDAMYINYNGGEDHQQCYVAAYRVPDHQAFWSITVYGDDGYMKNNSNVVNSRSVTLGEDGGFDVYFGSQSACGQQVNRVDVTEGWNYVMRIYRPGPGVLDQSYRLPEPELFMLKN